MPEWVTTGYLEYKKRIPRDFKILLTEIEPARRNLARKSIIQLQEEEGAELQKALLKNAFTIALDARGESWSTEQFAKKLAHCANKSLNMNFLIGGPDGLSKACLTSSDLQLSLSKMIFPHPLVRVILMEQIYRASCLLNNLPYAKH